MIPTEQLKRFVELDDKEDCTDSEFSEWTNMRFQDQREIYAELLALREQTRWRKYPDEKPEDDSRVLVEVEFHDNTGSRRFVLFDEYINGKFDSFYKKDVCRWLPAPLPSAPDAKGGE